MSKKLILTAICTAIAGTALEAAQVKLNPNKPVMQQHKPMLGYDKPAMGLRKPAMTIHHSEIRRIKKNASHTINQLLGELDKGGYSMTAKDKQGLINALTALKTGAMAGSFNFGKGEKAEILNEIYGTAKTAHNQIKAAKVGKDLLGHKSEQARKFIDTVIKKVDMHDTSMMPLSKASDVRRSGRPVGKGAVALKHAPRSGRPIRTTEGTVGMKYAPRSGRPISTTEGTIGLKGYKDPSRR